MAKYFFDKENLSDNEIVIEGAIAHHLINVMRVKIGDIVCFCDGEETDYITNLIEVYAKGKKITCVFVVTKVISCKTELKTKIRLFQGLPKGDKLELIVQKCVELGVFEIIPVNTRRTQFLNKNFEKSLNRLQKISLSAAEQSNRGIVPKIHDLIKLSHGIKICENLSDETILNFVAYEKEEIRTLKSIFLNSPTPKNINIWIGPEGGFDFSEINQLEKINAIPITLGKRILRTETAAIALTAQLQCFLEN